MSIATPPEQSAQEDGLSYLPIFLDLRVRLCLVLGDEAAFAKVKLLRRAGARVRVLADDLCEDLRQLADAGDIELRNPSVPVDLEGVALLVAKLGSVDLVGAGPGAADLLTLRAAEVIRKADVILYDRLVGKDILELARREARLVEVGKRAGGHSTAQKDINEQLLAFARAGLRVVRLKGGDPLVFGRGGEEAIFLRQHGIAVRIVPGVTAALGCAASIGVPLTFRGLAQKIVFLTGHSCDGELDLDWAALADPAATLAIYMGRANAARFSRELIEAGLPPSTPAVAIENGTWSNERHWFTNLRALPDAVAESASEWPLLVLIGRTVSLAQMSPQLETSEIEVAAA